MTNIRKGFTLIELLIVIAIIGILASILLVSLGGARASARDTRRIADLRQVQAALELFYNACNYYPSTRDPATGLCTQGAVGAWPNLQSSLINAGLNISQIPNDPTPSQTYTYGVDTNGGYQKYELGAQLENANQALNNMPASAYGVTCSLAAKQYCVQN